MSKKTKQCYYCGQQDTSKDHVPAKCFFPADPSCRKQLISVPACARHNEAASKDDEYVRSLIVMIIGNNCRAYQQFLDKVEPSLPRKRRSGNNLVGDIKDRENYLRFNKGHPDR
jgi:hypothetical protein